MERICYTTNGFFGFGSNELKEELKSKIKENDMYINFAYTDYGGDFFDKVCIEYFIKEYPQNIIWENTVYSGKNAYVFGDIVKEFWEKQENYLLGFENLEDFYYNMEREVTENDFNYFIDEELKDKFLYNRDEVLEYLLTEKSGYYSITTQGLDFSWSDLTEELLKENLIFNNEEKLLYLFLKNGYEKSIADYYVTTYENGNIQRLLLDEKTLSIIREYENSLVEA